MGCLRNPSGHLEQHITSNWYSFCFWFLRFAGGAGHQLDYWLLFHCWYCIYLPNIVLEHSYRWWNNESEADSSEVYTRQVLVGFDVSHSFWSRPQDLHRCESKQVREWFEIHNDVEALQSAKAWEDHQLHEYDRWQQAFAQAIQAVLLLDSLHTRHCLYLVLRWQVGWILDTCLVCDLRWQVRSPRWPLWAIAAWPVPDYLLLCHSSSNWKWYWSTK